LNQISPRAGIPHDSNRSGYALSKSIAWDDHVWYAVLPAVGYLFEAASGIALALRSNLGCVALALSLGLLLIVGIHNSWDITLWSITRRRD
jgi:hypothetical protein